MSSREGDARQRFAECTGRIFGGKGCQKIVMREK